MASLNFPANPTTGQIYVAPSGVNYQWNGNTWITYATAQLSLGPTGPTGATGPGLPIGGASGQVLGKTGPGDYEWDWIDGVAPLTGTNLAFQFNNGGVLNGATGFTYKTSTGEVVIEDGANLQILDAGNVVLDGGDISINGGGDLFIGGIRVIPGGTPGPTGPTGPSATSPVGSVGMLQYKATNTLFGGMTGIQYIPETRSLVIGSYPGSGVFAQGMDNFALGTECLTSGENAVAIGQFNMAEADFSMAIGRGTNVRPGAQSAFTQGESTVAFAGGSHAEGENTSSGGFYSHAEGTGTRTGGYASHGEGFQTFATGAYSHSEGETTTTVGIASHSEGTFTTTVGNYSHAEGNRSISVGIASHAEGLQTTSKENWSHAEGVGTITGLTGQSVVGKFNAEHTRAHFVIGGGTGNTQRSNIATFGPTGIAFNTPAFTLNGLTITGVAGGNKQIQFNNNGTQAGAQFIEVTGSGLSIANSAGGNEVSGNANFAVGYSCKALAFASVAEGGQTTCTANAEESHAQGSQTTAKGFASHAGGGGTIAAGMSQMAIGAWNIENGTASFSAGWRPFIVGIGTSNTNRRNALEVVSITRTAGAETGTIVLAAATGLNFTSDANAAAGNVPVGGIYHNAGAVRIRLS